MTEEESLILFSKGGPEGKKMKCVEHIGTACMTLGISYSGLSRGQY